MVHSESELGLEARESRLYLSLGYVSLGDNTFPLITLFFHTHPLLYHSALFVAFKSLVIICNDFI